MGDLCINFENGIKENKIMMISLQGKNYRDELKNFIEFSVNKFKKTCYVTVNDPYETIKDKLNSGVCSKVFFIDCVTSTIKSPDRKDDVLYVSSPHALTEISISLKKTLGKGVDFVLFDSISSMLIYENPITILKFIHGLIVHLRLLKINVAFIILKEDASGEIVKDLAMMVDKTLEV